MSSRRRESVALKATQKGRQETLKDDLQVKRPQARAYGRAIRSLYGVAIVVMALILTLMQGVRGTSIAQQPTDAHGPLLLRPDKDADMKIQLWLSEDQKDVIIAASSFSKHVYSDITIISDQKTTQKNFGLDIGFEHSLEPDFLNLRIQRSNSSNYGHDSLIELPEIKAHSKIDENLVEIIIDKASLTSDHFRKWTLEVFSPIEGFTLQHDLIIMPPCSVDTDLGVENREIVLNSDQQSWLKLSLEP